MSLGTIYAGVTSPSGAERYLHWGSAVGVEGTDVIMRFQSDKIETTVCCLDVHLQGTSSETSIEQCLFPEGGSGTAESNTPHCKGSNRPQTLCLCKLATGQLVTQSPSAIEEQAGALVFKPIQAFHCKPVYGSIFATGSWMGGN